MSPCSARRRSIPVTEAGAIPSAWAISFVPAASVQKVLEKTVAVRRHGDEIAPLAQRRVDDLAAGIAAGEYTLGLESVFLETVANVLEVLAVLAYLFRLAKIELPHVASREPISHANEHDGRFAVMRQ